jgi:rod shape-determining protein MreC
VVLIAMALMALDHRFNQLQTVRNVFTLLAYPVQLVIDAPIRLGSRILDSVSDHEQLVLENRLLRSELSELRARQLRFEALKMENDRLRALLNTSGQATEHVQIAKLLAVDLDPFRQQIVINKGSLDGVYAGQPLINAEGVVGQILTPHWTSSTALLISDPGHALPVIVARTGLRALAVGSGNPRRLNLRHVPPQEDIEEGDLLLTSGLGGRFPSRLPGSPHRLGGTPAGTAFPADFAPSRLPRWTARGKCCCFGLSRRNRKSHRTIRNDPGNRRTGAGGAISPDRVSAHDRPRSGCDRADAARMGAAGAGLLGHGVSTARRHFLRVYSRHVAGRSSASASRADCTVPGPRNVHRAADLSRVLRVFPVWQQAVVVAFLVMPWSG